MKKGFMDYILSQQRIRFPIGLLKQKKSFDRSLRVVPGEKFVQIFQYVRN